MPPTPQPQKLLSVLFSFRNEEENLPELLRRLREAVARLPVAAEFIFVNDASTDRSLEILLAEARQDPRVKIINLSRRFGVPEGFLAAMAHARGDAVITLDCDLQDPPEVIPQLVEKWLAGAEVVHTIRIAREGESALRKLLTRLAYKTINFAANQPLQVEAGDFKLIGRRVVDQLIRLNEKDPYMRGLVTWMGFRQESVHYRREARYRGKTHFPLLLSKGPLLTFATGMTSFSVLPLLGLLAAGFLLLALAVLGLAVLSALTLFAAGSPRYFWWLLAAGGFLSGLQMLGLGVLGLYLSRVYNDVRNRPHYIVDNTVGFEKPGQP
jgi:polyisoprenyl-phosphate glycosyltransferase